MFCAHCGNKTLKVSVTIGDDGTLHMHFSRNPKVLNPRGLRVSGTLPPTLTAEPGLRKPKHEEQNDQTEEHSSWFLQDSS